ncbi:hypothetical protein Slala03_76720 [Streptomyces lavendulae subsp. lavendulae]|uniref:hypothetical protein n=1 Tax=Streptomyces lavendulae TaxID=1914 RepID=UPI0024A2695E|nr:hypothetical protein [Streptomyces lavendulae]GLV87983.1 hypothetical protein Slala03_76720 [Streptomyces lavendulae subsp. lavendulae]
MNLSASSRPMVSLSALSSGSGSHVVVVDFTKFSGEQTASTLLGALVEGRSLLRADPVADLSITTGWLSLSDLAGAYAELLAGMDEPPVVLVGYCSAAPLALAIAAELADSGQRVPVQLIAPGFPDRQLVLDELDELRRTIGAPSMSAGLGLDDDSRSAMKQIRGVLQTDLVAAAVANGLSAIEAEILTEELGARYSAWLAYLLSAADAPAPAIPSDVRVVTSHDVWSAPQSGWPETACIHIGNELRPEFLDSENVARAVSDQLGDLL